jgi:AcrR family transcriptional regulator
MPASRERVTREIVLDEVQGFLDTTSLSDLTVDALARAVRRSKSSLYKFFSTKDALVDAVVERACDATLADVRAAGRATTPQVVASLVARHARRLPLAVLRAPPAAPRRARVRLSAVEAAIGEVASGVLPGDARLAVRDALARAGAVERAETEVAVHRAFGLSA